MFFSKLLMSECFEKTVLGGGVFMIGLIIVFKKLSNKAKQFSIPKKL